MLTIDNETTLESFRKALLGTPAFAVEIESPEGLETHSLTFPWMITSEFFEDQGREKSLQRVAQLMVEHGIKDLVNLLFNGDTESDGDLLGLLDGIAATTEILDDITITGTLALVDAGKNVFVGPNTGTLIVDLIEERTPDGESINVPMNLLVADVIDEKVVFASDGPLGTLYLIDVDDNEEIQKTYQEKAKATSAESFVKRLTFGFVKGEIERYYIGPE